MPTITDPVCGMTVDPATAAGSSTHNETTYYFCSPTCQQRFDANPGRFVAAGTTDQPAPGIRRWLRRK